MAKKILFVVTKSNYGGAQRYVFDLAQALKKDHDVAVAFGPEPDPIRKPSASNGAGGKYGRLSRLLVEVGIRTLTIPELGRDVNVGDDWRAFHALLGLFRDEQPHVVHLNSSKAGGLGALAARIARVPRIIFTSHGLPYDEDRPLAQRALIMCATWVTIALTHRTIMISSDTLKRAQRLPFVYRKLSLILNGIETPAFEIPAEARASLRTIDPSIPDGFLVGTIAELHPNKDLVTALDAIAQMQDSHFCIIGDGELKESLMAHARAKGIADRVHFLGYVPDAANYLRAFDAFLLTSVKEGLPYVLLEAGAAHVPIVAVDIPGVRDIVLNDFTGLLVPRDPTQIAAALSKLKDDAALVRSLSDEMGTRIQKTFSLRQMVEKTFALY